MKEFYIETGGLKETVTANSMQEAIEGAMSRAHEKEITLGMLGICRDTSLLDIPDNHIVFVPENVLDAIGLRKYWGDAEFKGLSKSDKDDYLKLKSMLKWKVGGNQ